MSFRAILLACAVGAAGLPTAAAARDFGGLFDAFGVAQQRPGDSLGAGWRQQQGEARERVREGDTLPLARVLGEVRRRTPGRLLDAGLEDQGGRPVYRIRWAAGDGRRIDYLVDARTGAILRADGA